MLVQSMLSGNENSLDSHSRRRHLRYQFSKKADWDFFTSGTGNKTGYVEDISQGGCLLRTTDAIEHRRWVRLLVKENHLNLWFTAVGRIIRREDRLEVADGQHVTLFRYGVEFIHPLNPLVLARLQPEGVPCDTCGNPMATIADVHQPKRHYCVLCHLRQACHNLLNHEALG